MHIASKADGLIVTWKYLTRQMKNKTKNDHPPKKQQQQKQKKQKNVETSGGVCELFWHTSCDLNKFFVSTKISAWPG